VISGIGCALLFGYLVIRVAEIIFEREPAGDNDR